MASFAAQAKNVSDSQISDFENFASLSQKLRSEQQRGSVAGEQGAIRDSREASSYRLASKEPLLTASPQLRTTLWKSVAPENGGVPHAAPIINHKLSSLTNTIIARIEHLLAENPTLEDEISSLESCLNDEMQLMDQEGLIDQIEQLGPRAVLDQLLQLCDEEDAEVLQNMRHIPSLSYSSRFFTSSFPEAVKQMWDDFQEYPVITSLIILSVIGLSILQEKYENMANPPKKALDRVKKILNTLLLVGFFFAGYLIIKSGINGFVAYQRGDNEAVQEVRGDFGVGLICFALIGVFGRESLAEGFQSLWTRVAATEAAEASAIIGTGSSATESAAATAKGSHPLLRVATSLHFPDEVGAGQAIAERIIKYFLEIYKNFFGGSEDTDLEDAISFLSNALVGTASAATLDEQVDDSPDFSEYLQPSEDGEAQRMLRFEKNLVYAVSRGDDPGQALIDALNQIRLVNGINGPVAHVAYSSESTVVPQAGELASRYYGGEDLAGRTILRVFDVESYPGDDEDDLRHYLLVLSEPAPDFLQQYENNQFYSEAE